MERRGGGPSLRERPAVLVTGSARGIGRACATKFAAEGWVVGALDVDASGLTDLAHTSEAVLPLVADVADEDAVRAATRELQERSGYVSASVNAAGIYPVSTLETADSQLYRRVYDVNVLGTLLVCQAIADSIPAECSGAIVNFASSDAYVPKPSQILY
jgi:3-oxoacyl-[acyl-carrier protein] reductase